MPTPKLDTLCVEFVKRLPSQLKLTEANTVFVPGSGLLPDAFDIGAASIIDYVNRALLQFFNKAWLEVKGNVQAMISILPELQEISASVNLTSGEYLIGSPYKNFYKIIGGLTSTNVYIKPKQESLYLFFLSGKYKNHEATATDPAIFQVGEKLIVMPNNVSATIRFHYIKKPTDPLTGNVLTQNGLTDSPFDEQWNSEIVELAYKKFLEETIQTAETAQSQ